MSTEFKLGQRVGLLETSFYYNQCEGTYGTVINEPYQGSGDKMWVGVKWDCGTTANYPINDLYHVEESEGETVSESKLIYPFKEPLLPGMRVMLNPEGENHKSLLKRAEGCDVGYVIAPLLGDREYEKWNRFFSDDEKAYFDVRVSLDNNRKINCNLRDLLPIDGKEKDVVKYVFLLGSIIGFEDKIQERVNERVIVQGDRIRRIIRYDDAWRKEIRDAVNEANT